MNSKVTPKDFFMWAGAMVALYVSIASFVTLMFEYIEHVFGTTITAGYNPYSGGLPFAIASLLVVFPLYIFLTRMLNQDIRRNPAQKELWVRRWLVFLAVFVAGIAMVIDLIVLLTTFLSGDELTAAFIAKVIVVLLLAAAVFYYYMKDMAGYWETHASTAKWIAVGTISVVIVSIVAAFFVIGSPHTQRLMQFDSQRIDDLTSLQYTITDYYRTKEVLPESLDVLRDPLMSNYIPNDPETGAPYEYEKTGTLTFNLCATFSLPQPEIGENADMTDYQVRALITNRENWPYNEGRTCFERTIDPDNYTTGDMIKPTVVR